MNDLLCFYRIKRITVLVILPWKNTLTACQTARLKHWERYLFVHLIIKTKKLENTHLSLLFFSQIVIIITLYDVHMWTFLNRPLLALSELSDGYYTLGRVPPLYVHASMGTFKKFSSECREWFIRCHKFFFFLIMQTICPTSKWSHKKQWNMRWH